MTSGLHFKSFQEEMEDQIKEWKEKYPDAFPMSKGSLMLQNILGGLTVQPIVSEKGLAITLAKSIVLRIQAPPIGEPIY